MIGIPDLRSQDDDQIIVFGDVHFASHWDRLSQQFSGWQDVINPNAELVSFIKRLTKGNRKPLAVNIGDSVDCFCATYTLPQEGFGDNRQLYYNLCDAAGFVSDEIPGNHDYRFMPHNLRFWGLEHINIAADKFNLLRKELVHTRIRNPLDELRSVFNFGSVPHPLSNFRGFVSPTLRQRAVFDCLYLNTGPDAFTRLGGVVGNMAKWLPARLKKRSEWSIDCFGLTSLDISSVESKLQKSTRDDLIIFMHAPLLNPVRDKMNQEFRLDPSRIQLSLRYHQLDQHVVASGSFALIDLLQSKRNLDRNCIVVAGHAHVARYMLIDKLERSVRQVTLGELNDNWNDARFIKHLVVLPLGVIDPRSRSPRMGYGRIGRMGFEEIVTRQFSNSARPRDGAHNVEEVNIHR